MLLWKVSMASSEIAVWTSTGFELWMKQDLWLKTGDRTITKCGHIAHWAISHPVYLRGKLLEKLSKELVLIQGKGHRDKSKSFSTSGASQCSQAPEWIRSRCSIRQLNKRGQRKSSGVIKEIESNNLFFWKPFLIAGKIGAMGVSKFQMSCLTNWKCQRRCPVRVSSAMILVPNSPSPGRHTTLSILPWNLGLPFFAKPRSHKN